jgi:hypothetical protein
MSLAEYGDSAALPFLSTALDECKVERSGDFSNSAIFELEAALEDPGRKLYREATAKN